AVGRRFESYRGHAESPSMTETLAWASVDPRPRRSPDTQPDFEESTDRRRAANRRCGHNVQRHGNCRWRSWWYGPGQRLRAMARRVAHAVCGVPVGASTSRLSATRELVPLTDCRKTRQRLRRSCAFAVVAVGYKWPETAYAATRRERHLRPPSVDLVQISGSNF